MKAFRLMPFLLYLFVCFLPCEFVYALDQKKEQWIGILNGRRIYIEDQKNILDDHERWLRTFEKEGTKADLTGARLQNANLIEVSLLNANLAGADLRGAKLRGAVLECADLTGADMRGANLTWANLRGARLLKVDLTRAILSGAKLRGATLMGANLAGADLTEANLQGAFFEPKNNPSASDIADSFNLSRLFYYSNPTALIGLRKEFKENGFRRQERELTYAIKQSGFLKAMREDDILTKVEVILGWIFFNFTSKWGLEPERPILILIGLIIILTIPYAHAISSDIYGIAKKDGIWKIWMPGRMRDDLGNDEEPKVILDSINPFFCFKMGFYFSFLSAFNIGWRELNVGNWISQIQPLEYKLQASGWVRSLSGMQSLISVYILALSVLTYFGRPFEY